MATPFLAKNAVVRVNNNVFIANQWTFNASTDTLDASNFEQPSAFKVWVKGLRQAEVTI